jgi:predicted N-formylglutamate amidohydrolase
MDIASAPPAWRRLAEPGGFTPVSLIDGDPASGLIILCDHAGNRLPAEYGNLGLPPAELSRHIAYDPGAAAVAQALAGRLGVPAVLANFSRLLIDANRGTDDPTLIMQLSDGTIVPGNALVHEREREQRINRFHAPYHAAVDAAIDRAIAAGQVPALISIHSFTPVWRGKTRPWHAGILWDADPRLAVPLIAALRADNDLVIGDNEPYSGALANDALYGHGTRRGLAHALIEIRQDLIGDQGRARAWAERLALILSDLKQRPQLHEIRHHGSRTGAPEPIEAGRAAYSRTEPG